MGWDGKVVDGIGQDGDGMGMGLGWDWDGMGMGRGWGRDVEEMEGKGWGRMGWGHMGGREGRDGMASTLNTPTTVCF